MATYRSLAAQIANDPSASFWLKAAILAAAKRDPVDALNDAEMLVEFCKLRNGESA